MAATALRETEYVPRGKARRAKPGQVKRAKPAKKAEAVKAPKSDPMSFRMDTETRALVDRAATVSGQNRTEFMLTTLRERAIEVLLNQRLFTLNESDWASFVENLDSPPPPNAKLKALLARVPVWDR